MPIEQTLPDKPKFGLIVAASSVVILILLALAVFFIRYDGRHLLFPSHQHNPNSMLTLPGAAPVDFS